jgi:SAM-dependent methyltransferase
MGSSGRERGAAPDSREAVEDRTRRWLGASFERSKQALRGRDHVVYDASGEPRAMTRFAFQEVLRKLKIFRWLDRLEFESFVDVGSGFDIYPKLVSDRYGVPGFFSDLTHVLNLPEGGATLGRLDHAVTLNLARLPFADGAFDVVLASEVLEHLVRPIEAIAELFRITRRYLIMTSLEALAVDGWRRFLSNHRVDVRVPHVERNFLLLREFEAVFGLDLHHENLIYDGGLPASAFASEAQQAASYGALDGVAALEAALVTALAVDDHRPGAMGILLVKAMPGAPAPRSRPDDVRPLARWLIERTAWAERTALEMLRRHDGPGDYARFDRPVAAGLVERLCCPDCRASLVAVPAGVACRACGTDFLAEYGVPILYPQRPHDPAIAAAEALRRLCGDDAARRRVVRRLMRRLRRNERPPGRLRQWAWRAEERLGLRP